MVLAIALAIEHAHHFVAHHQWYGQLGARRFRRTKIARVFADVRRIHRMLLVCRGARDALAQRHPNLVLPVVPADLRADVQFLRLLVEQHNGHTFTQMKIVVRDAQNALQHLVQIKGGEHSLARVVQDRNFIHWLRGIS